MSVYRCSVSVLARLKKISKDIIRNLVFSKIITSEDNVKDVKLSDLIRDFPRMVYDINLHGEYLDYFISIDDYSRIVNYLKTMNVKIIATTYSYFRDCLSIERDGVRILTTCRDEEEMKVVERYERIVYLDKVAISKLGIHINYEFYYQDDLSKKFIIYPDYEVENSLKISIYCIVDLCKVHPEILAEAFTNKLISRSRNIGRVICQEIAKLNYIEDIKEVLLYMYRSDLEVFRKLNFKIEFKKPYIEIYSNSDLVLKLLDLDERLVRILYINYDYLRVLGVDLVFTNLNLQV